MGSKVLVVDDEKLIVKGIRFSLEQDGMEVDTAFDGEEALAMINEKEYDMVLLDLMLPKMDGLEVCQNIRGFSDVPIIIITAKSEDMDKIMGLEYGADDYITKPFNILEVKARIKAILRRNAKNNPDEYLRILEKGDIKMELDGRRLFVSGEEMSFKSAMPALPFSASSILYSDRNSSTKISRSIALSSNIKIVSRFMILPFFL